MRLLLDAGARTNARDIEILRSMHGVVFVKDSYKRINAMLEEALAKQQTRAFAPALPPQSDAAPPPSAIRPNEPPPPAQKPWWTKGDAK